MDLIDRETPKPHFLDRFRKSWFPPAAIVGALAAFTAASFRTRPAPKVAPQQPKPAGTPKTPQLPAGSATPGVKLDREYSKSTVLGSETSAHPFRRSLSDIGIGPGDTIYALGDGEVRLFDPDGKFLQGWKVAEDSACLAAGADGRIYIGAPGRVEIYEAGGRRAGGFAVGEKAEQASITAIHVFRGEILAADASVRYIRRYSMGGKELGQIGTRNKTGNFILPNRWLDFDVDAKGVVRATDTGRHLVTAWAIDGTPLGSFGKFGMFNPTDFVGCCNPVNLALTPDGKVVTGEKMVARVKVYEPEGRLIALIGPENFDPNCVHIHLAVDSKGRILAADPARREVKIFSLVKKAASSVERNLPEIFGIPTGEACAEFKIL